MFQEETEIFYKLPFSVNPTDVNLDKKRLVVIEASWEHGKSVANRINIYRRQFGLLPLQYVRLSSLTGQYWKFQNEGLSAVSSIEAIAYTALEAGCSQDTFENLLTLFRLQKYRVLSRLVEGGKPPKAIKVSGDGMRSWEDLLGDE